MTSESEFVLVELTHFINPHLFWINRIEEDDTEYKLFYDKLQDFAGQSETCVPHLKKVYAFKDPVKNIWARGVIELDIDLQVAQSLLSSKVRDKTYKVWLIDEGRPIDVSHLPHKLPTEFREKETKCERCILFGVIPAITDIDMCNEVFEKRRVFEWQNNAKTIVKDLLSKRNAQVYFKTRKYLENVTIGDLQIVLKNKLFNVAEYLVEKGFAFMDENNFLKVQRHIILSPTCRVKTPSDIQSRPSSSQSRPNSNLSRPDSRQSKIGKKITSNTSSRSISVQSEIIPKRPPSNRTIESAITDDLDDISDLVDSDPPIRAFNNRTSIRPFVHHRKPINSESSSSENEIGKLQQTVPQTKPLPQVKTTENTDLILNRTAGRGSRRSMKLKKENNSFEEESSQISDSQNESLNFQSNLISCGRGTRKHLKSPENLNENDSLSVRKKLFDSKDKMISNISGKTPAKKLFTDISSINTIDHTLAMNQDAEFYDTTDSEITCSEEVGKSKSGKGSEVKTCIAIIKNIDEIQPNEKQIIEEEILVVGKSEDDDLFLKRFKQKEAQKLDNERRIVGKQTTVKPMVSNLLKILKIKKPSSTTTNDPKSSSTSSNFDASSSSQCESNASSNEFTDNEKDKTKHTQAEDNSTWNWPKLDEAPTQSTKLNIMPAGALIKQPSSNKFTDNEKDKIKHTQAEDNSTWNWPKVDEVPTQSTKLNIMPAGALIERNKKKENNYQRPICIKINKSNIEEAETTESFLERQIKTFQSGRNIKEAALSPVLIAGGLNNYLIHSLKKITPIQNVGQAYLHSDIRSVLTSLNIIELHNLQRYVWPAINRGENVVAIWPKYKHNQPDENSCMMFLPVLCNTVIENNYDDLEKFGGPIVLILCAHKTAARIVYEKTLLLLNLIIKREKLENAKKFKNKSYNERAFTKNRAYLLLDNVIDTIRGDIVISTPKCFMNRLNKMREYDSEFRRLCHLVIDDADIITDRYSTELNEILSQCQFTLNRRRNAIRNIQSIFTAEKWTNGVEELCKKSQIKPAICIETPIEAAIYAKVNMSLQFIRKETKIEVLYELINQKITTFKTLLMCNKYSEIEEVVKFLNTKGIEALSYQKRVTGTEIKHTFDQWNSAPSGAYKLLVLTDDVLADIGVTSAMWLIHYTLPRTWTHFSKRFNAISANYPSFYATSNKSIASPKVHIFIDESHIEVVPRMLNILERLSKNADFTKLLPLKEAAIIAKEEKKSELCYLLLSTGACPNEYRCNKRHLLFPNIDSPKFSNIKIGSSIQLKFIEQYDAVHYSARLIDSENNYKILSLDLANHYRENPGKLTIIDINKIYAYKKTDTLYERCKIMEKSCRSSSTSTEDYKILLIDTGEVKTVKLNRLFDLPERFIKEQTEHLALNVFIANVKPSHDEIIWDIENKTKLQKILSGINIYDPDIFITCDVQLTIGNFIWIDNVKIIEKYSERLNLTYELEREHIVEKNPRHLKNLIELCKRANINLIYQELDKSIEKTNDKIKKSQFKIQNAFLEVGNNFEEVYILSTDDIGTKFYLGRYDLEKSLQYLLDDIQTAVKDVLYPKEFDIVENKYCLAYMLEYKYYYRAQIRQIEPNQEIKCFLIDEGYEKTFNKNDLISIRQWMLTKLPAQSIPCRLFGVQYNASILEQFEDMYTTSWAKCVQRDPDGTHAVLLIKNCNGSNVIINNFALGAADSKPITSEVFIDDDYILPEINESNSDEEITDYLDTANSNPSNNILDLISTDKDSDISEDEGVCIYDPEEFFKGLFRNDGPPIKDYKTKLENTDKKNKDKNLSPIEYSDKMIDPETEEIVSSGLLPTVLWHQTNSTIVLKIQLIDIKDYYLSITKDSLLFRTDYDGKFYELNLTLYEKIDDNNYFHESKGMEFVIKLTKSINGSKWPRLLKSKQRFRNIKLNIDIALSDDEEDGEKFVPFLQEFSQLKDDESDEEECRIEMGSDDDNSSDWTDNEACDS